MKTKTSPKRRLSVYPGQVSMIINIDHAEETFEILKANLSRFDIMDRGCIERYINRMAGAIRTAENLCAKRSKLDKETANVHQGKNNYA